MQTPSRRWLLLIPERFGDFPGGGSTTCMAVAVKVLPRRKIDDTCKDFNLKGFIK